MDVSTQSIILTFLWSLHHLWGHANKHLWHWLQEANSNLWGSTLA